MCFLIAKAQLDSSPWDGRPVLKTTIQYVNAEMIMLEKAGVQLEISWTPGHADIKGNEHADRFAKELLKKQRKKKICPR